MSLKSMAVRSALLALTFGLLVSAYASAEEATYVDIPAGDLATALDTLAREVGVQFVYSVQELKGIHTDGVKGEWTTEKAVEQLIKGTNLTLTRHESGALLIAPARVSPPATGQLSENANIGRMAQAEELASAPELQEIVVTAQKRAERLVNVPISISVLNGQDLDQSTFVNSADALRTIPGVAATTSVFGGGTQLAVRGVSASAPLYYGSSPIAFYVDSVPFGLVQSSIVPDTNVYDLERIEVLRGPQGTLYGAGAQNGVIRILTHEADLSGFELKARGTISSTNGGGTNSGGDMAINIPLIEDKLAVRAVLGYQDLSGWISRPGAADANDAKLKSGRLKVNSRLTDQLTVGLSAWFSRSNYGAPDYSADDRRISRANDEWIKNGFDAYSVKVGYEFAGASLTSTSSFIDYQNRFNFEFAPYSLYTDNGDHIFTQEVYLNSSGSGPWRWTVGGSFRDGKDRLYQNLTPIPPPGVFDDVGSSTRSEAVFGSLTRLLADGRFEVTAGLRYFYDRVGQFENKPYTSDQNAVPINLTKNFNKLSPRLVFTWHPGTDLTTYVSYSEGFRSGFNQEADTLRVTPNLPPARADNLKNYELGAKGVFWGGRLNVDTAAYYIDWVDVQQPVSVLYTNGLYYGAVLNGTGVSGPGLDFNVNVEPAQGFTLGINASWNGLEQDANVIFVNAQAPQGVIAFPKGTRANFSPALTWGTSANYAFPLGAGNLTGKLSASANHLSSQFRRRVSGATVSSDDGDPILLARVSAAVSSGDRWSATLFVDNVNNERKAFINNWTGDPELDLRPRPRTVGMQIDYHTN